MRIVETDNFGGDYPDEKFVNLPPMDTHTCNLVCDIINHYLNKVSMHSRYYKVVQNDYKLVGGFEP